MPKVYEVSMVIMPIEGIEQHGEISPQFLNFVTTIEQAIKERAFNGRIAKELKLTPKDANIKFNVIQPRFAQLLRISIENTQDRVDMGKAILNQLVKSIESTYGNVAENKKKLYEKDIEITVNNIAVQSSSIKQKQSQLKILEDREKELMVEIKKTADNTEKLISQREGLLKGSKENDISSLLYTTTIQQNIIYFNQLNNELTSLKSQKEGIPQEIFGIEKDIKNSNISINKIDIQKDDIVKIALIQEPEVSPLPIRPKKMRNVAVAGAISLIWGMAIAIFVELWERGKSRK